MALASKLADSACSTMTLAERKKKQRIPLDPQNKTWSSSTIFVWQSMMNFWPDQDSAGFKLLQKMGWKEGQGLGKNEDGIAKHVRVTVKGDLLGVGANRNDSESSWLRNTRGFEELLQELNQRTKDQEESNNLAERERQEEKNQRREKRKAARGLEPKALKTAKKKPPKAKASKVEPVASPPKLPSIAIHRLAHRRKYIQNKQVDQYANVHMQEIFGSLSSYTADESSKTCHLTIRN